MPTRRVNAPLRGAGLAAALLLLPSLALACSGPPPPEIGVLPMKVEFEYIDPATGDTVTLPPVEIADGEGNKVGDTDFTYCSDDRQVNCFDGSVPMTRLEVPAGAKVTFQAYYAPSGVSGNPGDSVFDSGKFKPIRELLGSILSSQAQNNGGANSIKLTEMASRGSGGAFTTGGGIRPKLILDWSGGYANEGGYELQFDGTTQLSQPTGWTGAWDGTKEKYYTTGSYAGREAVRKLTHDMAADAGNSPPTGYWIALDTSGATINGVHVWAETNGSMTPTGGMRLQFANDTEGSTSTWNWDVAGGGTKFGELVRLPANGDPASGVGFSEEPEKVSGPQADVDDGTFEGRFRRRHVYQVPSEPGGYTVQIGVSFTWKYGTQAAGGSPWKWDATITHLGYIDLSGVTSTPMNTGDGGPGAAVNDYIMNARAALGCLPDDPPQGDPDGCPYGTFDPGWIASEASNLAGGGDAIATRLKNLITSNGGTIATDPAFTASGSTETLAYSYSGKFPQSTGSAPPGAPAAGGAGTPGYAYVMVRDTSAPRFYRFLQPGDEYFVSGGGPYYDIDPADPMIEGAKTGQRIMNAIREDDPGAGSKIQVAVYDDNPNLVAYAAREGIPAYVRGTGGGFTQINGLEEYAGIVDAASSFLPTIQVWYTAQKAGYTPRMGEHYAEYGRFTDDISGGAGPQFVANARHEYLADDSRLEPRPTFRFYPFRDISSGEVRNYTPVGYYLLQEQESLPGEVPADEPIASVLVYEIDLEDAIEPMGLHYGDGSLEGTDSSGNVVFPQYTDTQLRLFIRASNGRLRADVTGDQLIPYPLQTPMTGIGDPAFSRPNWAPFWMETEGGYDPSSLANPDSPFIPDHQPGLGGAPSLHYAINPFPDDQIPRNLGKELTDNNIFQPPELGFAAIDQVAKNQAGFDAAQVDGRVYGKAAGIKVQDTVPPTVLLAITDTKYDRTYVFGNPFVGDMTFEAMQRLLKQAEFGADPDAGNFGEPSADTRTIDPGISIDDEDAELANDPPAVLFPYTAHPYASWTAAPSDPNGAYTFSVATVPDLHELPTCDDPDVIAAVNCLHQPAEEYDTGGSIWFFEHGEQGEPDAYLGQLDQMANGVFAPMKFWAQNTVVDAAPGDPAGPPGLWVDEDSRLVFKVIVWDNLNSYLDADPSTPDVADPTTEVDGYKGFAIYGAENSAAGIQPRISELDRDPLGLNVTIVDEPSGAGTLSLAAGDLRSSWPSYIFRNPNRLDSGSDTTFDAPPSDTTSYIEVQFSDQAGNMTRMRVNFYVIENNLRILSLKENKFRSFDGE